MNRKEIISKLNHLITRNYDSEYGYKEGEKKVQDPKLKNFLKHI